MCSKINMIIVSYGVQCSQRISLHKVVMTFWLGLSKKSVLLNMAAVLDVIKSVILVNVVLRNKYDASRGVKK